MARSIATAAERRQSPARAMDAAIRNRQPEGWGGLDGSLSVLRLQPDQHENQKQSVPPRDRPS